MVIRIIDSQKKHTIISLLFFPNTLVVEIFNICMLL